MSDVNTQFIFALIIIIIGYIIKKIGILSEKDGESLAKIILNVTLPSLILITISNIQLDINLLAMPFLCIGFSILALGTSILVFRKIERKTKGILIITSIGFNIGLFAYPLVEGIFGREGLADIAMFDVGNSFIIFGVVFILASIYSVSEADKKGINYKSILKRTFTNIPLLAYIAALLINVIIGGISGSVYSVLSIIAQANQPMVLLLLGIFLNLNIDKEHWKYISKVLIIRYGLGFLAGLLFYLFIPFNHLMKTILFIAPILPIGMAVIPYSVKFKLDYKLTGTLTNMTIIISFALMWVILSIVNI